MNKEIICKICHQLLSSPYTFQCCFSSVCQACLKKSAYKDNKALEKYRNSCEFCQKAIENSGYAIPNSFLAEFIEHIKNKEFLHCDCCEKEIKYNQSITCHDCGNKPFCLDCFTVIHSVGKYQHHEKSHSMHGLTHQAHNLAKRITCYFHPKEKVEFICLTDLTIMCNKCSIVHKKDCKTSRIVVLKDAHSDLQTLLAIKKEKLSHFKTISTNGYENLSKKLEDLEVSYRNNKQDLQDQFLQLHEIISFKEKESLTTLENLYRKQKDNLQKELKTLKQNTLRIENIQNIIEFALTYQNICFFESPKYLCNKVEHALKILREKKNLPDLTPLVVQLRNIDECKNFLYSIQFSDSLSEQSNSSTIKLKIPSRPYTPLTGETTRRKSLSPLTKYSTSRLYDTRPDSVLTDRERSQNISLDTVQSERSNLEEDIINKNLPKLINSSTLEKKKTAKRPSLIDSLCKKLVMKPNTARLSLKISDSIGFDPGISSSNNFSSTCSNSISCSRGYLFLDKSLPMTPNYEKRKKLSLFPLNQSTTLEPRKDLQLTKHDIHHLAELQKNPLSQRIFTEIHQTATNISIAWTHIFEHTNVIYQVEYGVGAKVQGVEQFRTAYRGKAQNCTIYDLMPKTTYRFRVRSILPKFETLISNQDTEEIFGDWSKIISVTTRDFQKIDSASLGTHAKITLKDKETCLEFEKSGVVTALDPYYKGKSGWIVELKQQYAHQTTDDSNSSIKVGVTNRIGKGFNLFGTLINYGLKESITIKVILDSENRCLTVYSPANIYGETINNLPEGPLYPAFQNKTNKNSNFSVLLFIKFDLSFDQIDKRES